MSPHPTVGGFTVIPTLYSDPSSSKTHYLYARAHVGPKNAAKNPWPNGRTLFVVNVPPDATERELVMFFKPYGTVERVVFDLDGEIQEEVESDSEDEDEEMNEVEGEEVEDDEDEDEGHRRKRRKVNKPEPPKVVPLPSRPLRRLRKTGQTVHVIFLDSSSLDRTLSTAPQKSRPWPVLADEEPSGLEHYTALYDSLRPPLDAIREHADTWMELFEFEAQKAKQKSKYRKGEAIVDEDGFTLVTRGGAYGQTLGGGVAVATKKFQETGEASERLADKAKKKKEKTNFYAFQKAEKQRKDLMDLKRKWEEDKAKVEKLKASRHFKPY
ncbi:hypothetical protein VNI00_014677 [Paramarasmius palmivorus]|uniref:RRM domain-containing protein n=1 Tax=Paramarasmius palmivorus TaxID=297713 RepID=A0AAW0BRD7_9AGAR